MTLERTFIMIKPDGVMRALMGEVISRIERKGLRIAAMKMMHLPRTLAERHYAEHQGKPFYTSLLDYITSGPVVAMVVEGEDAIETMRALVGQTDPGRADPGTIRFDLALEIGRNIVHASDGPESAAREIPLFFREDEILGYRRADHTWLHEKGG